MEKYPDNIRVYDDFLPPEVAQKLYSRVSSIPQQWFSLRKNIVDETSEVRYSKTWWSIHGDKSPKAHLDETHQQRMTYQFLATSEHQDNCDCTYCDMVNILRNNPAPEVSDHDLIESMLTVYRPGDFLSQHMDSRDNRSWAFTYTLTTGWRPEWGGILNVQDNRDGEWYAFVPKFNRLILMDVGMLEESSCNHFVSQVIEDAPVNRVTLSGWYGSPFSANNDRWLPNQELDMAS